VSTYAINVLIGGFGEFSEFGECLLTYLVWC